MYQIDEHVQLNFTDPKYKIIPGENENGEKQWTIAYNPTTDANGNEVSDFNYILRKPNVFSMDASVHNIRANIGCSLKSSVQDMQVVIFTVKVLVAVCAMSDGENSYLLICNRVARENELETNAALIAKYMNAAFSAIVFKGKSLNAETITADMVLDPPEPFTETGERAKSKLERAVPEQGQHTQYDYQSKTKSSLGFLGGMVSINATGTEFACRSLDDSMYGEPELNAIYERAVAADTNKTDLADRASVLSQLFYTSPEGFDGAHDRKSEIAEGQIQRAYMYDALRSFGWTLAAYCASKNMKPADADFTLLSEVIAFVNKYKHLNFKPNTYLKTLCGGDDIHDYYIPNGVSQADRRALINRAKLNAGDQATHVYSLEGYRSDLEYLWPAMLTIAKELYSDRNEDEALEGDTADILYAWCACAVGSRGPFYTEDGPVNNMFEHPLAEDSWEMQFARQMEEERKKHSAEWMNAHARDLNRGAAILFRDKKFVFDAYFEGDDRLHVVEKLTAKGGLERSAVSGQTDYLVCDPKTAGDSKIRGIKEQRAKGRCLSTKIVLVDDFLKALGYTPAKQEDTVARKQQAAKAQIMEAKAALDKLLNIGSTAEQEKLPKEASLKLVYRNGLKYENQDYEMDIPEGFILNKEKDGRDFIAFLPGEEDPDNADLAKVQILPGTVTKLPSALATAEGYSALLKALMSSIPGANYFRSNETIDYVREDLPGVIQIGTENNYINAQAMVVLDDSSIKMIRITFSDVPEGEQKQYQTIIRMILDHMRSKRPVSLAELPDSERFLNATLDNVLETEWEDLVDKHLQEIGTVFNVNANAAVSAHKAGENVAKTKRRLQTAVDTAAEQKDRLIERCCRTFCAQSKKNSSNPALQGMKIMIDTLMGNPEFTISTGDAILRAVCPNIERYKAQIRQACTTTPIQAERTRKEDSASREELNARMLGSMKAPISGLSSTLTQIANQKEASAAEAKRKAEAEAKCKAEEEARRKAEEERKKREETRKKAEEEAKRKAEEEKKRKEKERRIAEEKKEEARNKAKAAYHSQYDSQKKQKADLENELRQTTEKLTAKRSEAVTVNTSNFIPALAVSLILVGIVILFSAHGTEKLFGVALATPGILILTARLRKSGARKKELIALENTKADLQRQIDQIGSIPTEEDYIRTHTK